MISDCCTSGGRENQYHQFNILYNGYGSYIPKSVFFEHRFLVDEYYSKKQKLQG